MLEPALAGQAGAGQHRRGGRRCRVADLQHRYANPVLAGGEARRKKGPVSASEVALEIGASIDDAKIITWADYKRQDGELTWLDWRLVERHADLLARGGVYSSMKTRLPSLRSR